MDKIAHHIEVRRLPKRSYVDTAGINLKAIYLTGGDLSCYKLTRKKSAEVVLALRNEPMIKSEDSQKR